MHLRDTLAINPSCWVIAITYLDTHISNQTRITLKIKKESVEFRNCKRHSIEGRKCFLEPTPPRKAFVFFELNRAIIQSFIAEAMELVIMIHIARFTSGFIGWHHLKALPGQRFPPPKPSVTTRATRTAGR